MHPYLEQIFSTQQFLNSKNEVVAVHSETSKDQCAFLQKIIRDNKCKNSLEIGFANGISALAIVEEVSKNGGRHFVIDKFQKRDWHDNGIDLLNIAGYKNEFDFSDKYCYEILPELMFAGKKFDFAYIDSTKQFDWLLVDFFYIDKILEKNGFIVFDDVVFSGIRKLLRYIAQFPDYKVYAQYPQNFENSTQKKIFRLGKYLPFSEKWLKQELYLTDNEIGVNSWCVALQKTGEDSRHWDWHVDF